MAFIVHNGIVPNEMLDVMTPGRPYSRNDIHTIEAMALASLAASERHFGVRTAATAKLPNGAISAVGSRGGLAPVAQRKARASRAHGGTSGARDNRTRSRRISRRRVDALACKRANVQTVTVIGVVARFIGYDAASYGIYTRSGATWKTIFTGGGAAN